MRVMLRNDLLGFCCVWQHLEFTLVVVEIRRLAMLLVNDTLDRLREGRARRIVSVHGVVQQLPLCYQVLLGCCRHLSVPVGVVLTLLCTVLAGICWPVGARL